jgi:pilus assembly protein Flp/PilA
MSPAAPPRSIWRCSAVIGPPLRGGGAMSGRPVHLSLLQELFDMKNLALRLINETEGQDLIEYALLAALIALAAIVAMQNLGGAINSKFNSISTSLGSAS